MEQRLSVYVDEMEAQYGRMIMCHMVADTREELLAMCDLIGVQRKWIQHPDTWKEHFDIAKVKKALAIQHGAILIDRKTYVNMMRRRRGAPEIP